MLRALGRFLYRYGSILLLVGFLPSCSGKIQSALPTSPARSSYVQYGTASWYGEPFHGRRTANGEIYDMYEITAAHLVAPLGIYVLVTNLDNGRSARVRINDRGPYVGERILDLSYGAARKLGMIQAGLARVRIEFFPETVPSPTFIVQAGAYLDQDRALRLQKILSARHPQVWVVEAREGSTTFYRVRLGTFSSRSDAEQTARQIAALGYVTSIMPLPSSAHALRPNENRF